MCGVGPAASVATSAAPRCSGFSARIFSSSAFPIAIPRRTLRFYGVCAYDGASGGGGSVAQPAPTSATSNTSRNRGVLNPMFIFGSGNSVNGGKLAPGPVVAANRPGRDDSRSSQAGPGCGPGPWQVPSAKRSQGAGCSRRVRRASADHSDFLRVRKPLCWMDGGAPWRWDPDYRQPTHAGRLGETAPVSGTGQSNRNSRGRI